MSKLEIHNSKNKNKSDDTIVDVASDRFYDDDGYDEGDWGRADKQYTPGATYDHEMRIDKLTEATAHAEVAKRFGYTPKSDYHIRSSATNFEHKPSGHVLSVHKDGQWELHGAGANKTGAGANDLHQYLKKVHFTQQHESTRQKIKTVLSENGYVRGKGGIYSHENGLQVKYPLLDGTSYQIMELDVIGHTAVDLEEQLMSVDFIPESMPNIPLLVGILQEAVEFQKLPTTTCGICSGNHPESKHVSAPGVAEAELTEHRPKGASGNPINQKGGIWKQIKKKLHLEGEAEEFQMGNDQLVGMTEEDPSPDDLQKATITKPVAGKEVLDELGEGKKFKVPKFDQGKEVRAIARERVGQPKAKVIIKSKKLKPEKYKKDYMNEMDGAPKGFGQFIRQCEK